jgi:hypothetical protein
MPDGLTLSQRLKLAESIDRRIAHLRYHIAFLSVIKTIVVSQKSNEYQQDIARLLINGIPDEFSLQKYLLGFDASEQPVLEEIWGKEYAAFLAKLSQKVRQGTPFTSDLVQRIARENGLSV